VARFPRKHESLDPPGSTPPTYTVYCTSSFARLVHFRKYPPVFVHFLRVCVPSPSLVGGLGCALSDRNNLLPSSPPLATTHPLASFFSCKLTTAPHIPDQHVCYRFQCSLPDGLPQQTLPPCYRPLLTLLNPAHPASQPSPACPTHPTHVYHGNQPSLLTLIRPPLTSLLRALMLW
jgi:hypothetical protein